MLITQLQLKNFRCFSDTLIDIPHALTLIEGVNGSGKTSLLEALHYLCYLRSFRTYSPQELLNFGQESFFLRASFQQGFINHEIQVGFSDKKRLVKIDQKTISSFKELMDFYRIVTLTESDIQLITDGPEVRRLFIDQAIMLYDLEYATTIRSFRQVLEHRNALLLNTINADSYALWTEQLWEKTMQVAERRVKAIKQLERVMNELLREHFQESLLVRLEYKYKKFLTDSYAHFQNFHPDLKNDEYRFNRSLFGAHLDDIVIQFQEKKSKNYSSRGQQKLVVLLLKVALIKEILNRKGPVVFLLDDFMTDFDGERAKILIDILLNLKIQLIFTYPNSSTILEELLISQGGVKIKLTH